MFAWTPELETEVLKLWDEGLSASLIAKQLHGEGGGPSRNAVIGKVTRLRDRAAKAGEPAPEKRQAPRVPRAVGAYPERTLHEGRAPAAPRALKETPPRSPARELMRVVPTQACTPQPLTSGGCKWPIGDPKADDFGFCGAPRDVTLPYCEDHLRLAHPPRAAASAKELYRSLRRHYA